jgi:hypothetical protein
MVWGNMRKAGRAAVLDVGNWIVQHSAQYLLRRVEIDRAAHPIWGSLAPPR